MHYIFCDLLRRKPWSSKPKSDIIEKLKIFYFCPQQWSQKDFYKVLQLLDVFDNITSAYRYDQGPTYIHVGYVIGKKLLLKIDKKNFGFDFGSKNKIT